MSALEPIILIDDDESSLVEDASAAAKCPSNTEQDLETFINVTGWNKMAAKLALSKHGNLHLALSRVFDEGEENTNKKNSVAREKPAHNFKAASVKKTVDNDDGILHPKWHECIKAMQETGQEVFVDSEFPPTASSLDGRLYKEEKEQSVVRCHCGIPATARSVQSDGPNHGRFYLACGQQQRKRKQWSNNRKIPVVNPYASRKPAIHQESCNFFQWDRDGSLGSSLSSRWSHLEWHHFGLETNSVLFHDIIGPDQVRQGSIGNCWFLSALAVVAEKPYLIQRLLPHTALNRYGCYQINLCLDGKWLPILVDSSLAVLHENINTANSSKLSFKGGVLVKKNLVACPAFAATPKGQLWPALVEKAYAKAHGSYAQLSGGFIAEALLDLTGAPTETVVFDNSVDKDELWARLLSFSEAGFLMGVATTHGGQGLVGGHAYSVLQVLEQHDAIVGEQQKVTDFFTSTTSSSGKKRKDPPSQDDNVIVLPHAPHSERKAGERTTIRLVRIRNPWGKREWKGEWSVNSEQWTRSLRKKLGDKAFAKGDGTFFMSFDDMLERFHHMDVAKCREGWTHGAREGRFVSVGKDPIASSQSVFLISVTERTWAFLSLIQPKKRANTKSQYWYTDPSVMILKKKDSTDAWVCEVSKLMGVSRTCDCEVFLDPRFEYWCVPFSTMCECNNLNWSDGSALFRLTSYSSSPIAITPRSRNLVDNTVSVDMLHRELLRSKRKLQYVVAPKCVLVCVHGQGCLYFVAVNASSIHFLLLKLVVELKKGVMISVGRSNDSHDVPPRTQKLLLVVCSDGKFSSSKNVPFTYASDILATKLKDGKGQQGSNRINGHIDITAVGDLIAGSADPGTNCNKGGDSVDTHDWIGMLGATV